MDTSIKDADGSPAEVGLLAATGLVAAADAFQREAIAAEVFIRNAAMSELLEIEPDADPSDVLASWESSKEKALIDQMKNTAADSRRLAAFVRNYEGYRG